MNNAETSNPPACGTWTLSQEIGRGAYGVVYLSSGADGEHVAVKVCRRADVGDERYERELRGARLYIAIPPQEGLVRMRELAETDWGFYAVMDLADDEFGAGLDSPSGYRPKTLASVIESEKALPLKECLELALSLSKGLLALQRHHLLHRDIKPGNVIFVGGRPVLSDPGLLVEQADAVSIVGTPGYVPPEKFTDAASDIYSLGLTLKAASFGRTVEELDKGPSQEADTGAALFSAWWRILNKATDRTPSCRYQSARALLNDIQKLRWKLMAAPSRNIQMVFKLVIAAIVILIFAKTIWSDIGRRAEERKKEAETEKVKADARRTIERVKPSVGSALGDAMEDIESMKKEFSRTSKNIKNSQEGNNGDDL